ncbi:MAG: nucleotidyltransferase domain-containing protein [Nitrospirae bacterium]|nr:nucleotidyltransferase domain-containing protein [Nitrospirota bacterium]
MKSHNIQNISDYLSKYPVAIAYLFGSEAKGTSGVLSDIDIAVFFDKKTDKSERFDMRLRLSSELSSIKNKSVDLILLNDSPVQLSYEVIKHGKLIFCKEKSMQVDFEMEILSKYLDRRYYDKRHAELVMEKIASRGL